MRNGSVNLPDYYHDAVERGKVGTNVIFFKKMKPMRESCRDRPSDHPDVDLDMLGICFNLIE